MLAAWACFSTGQRWAAAESSTADPGRASALSPSLQVLPSALEVERLCPWFRWMERGGGLNGGPKGVVQQEPVNVALFGKRVFADVTKVRTLDEIIWMRVGLKCNDLHPYNLERHLQKEKPHDEGERDWNEVSTSQGLRRIARGTRSWGEAWNRRPQSLQEGSACQHFHFTLPASRTVKEEIPVV